MTIVGLYTTLLPAESESDKVVQVLSNLTSYLRFSEFSHPLIEPKFRRPFPKHGEQGHSLGVMPCYEIEIKRFKIHIFIRFFAGNVLILV